MRTEALVAAAAGLAGVCVGALLTGSLAEPAASQLREPDPEVIARALERALAGVETRLDRLAARERAPRAEDSAAAGPSEDGSSSEAERPDDLTPAARPPNTPPAPDPARLHELEDWNSRPEVRRAWLFTPERQILDAFGFPDGVVVRGATGEDWDYWSVADGKIEATRHLIVHDGRLVAAWTEKHDPPLSLPGR